MTMNNTNDIIVPIGNVNKTDATQCIEDDENEQKYMKITKIKLFGHSYEIKHKKQNNTTNPFIVYPSICFHIINKKIKGKNIKNLLIDWINGIFCYMLITSFMGILIGFPIVEYWKNKCERGNCEYLLKTYNIQDDCQQFNKVTEDNIIYNHYNNDYESQVNDTKFHRCIEGQITIYNITRVGWFKVHKIMLYALICFAILSVMCDLCLRIFLIILDAYDRIKSKINDEMPDIVDSAV